MSIPGCGGAGRGVIKQPQVVAVEGGQEGRAMVGGEWGRPIRRSLPSLDSRWRRRKTGSLRRVAPAIDAGLAWAAGIWIWIWGGLVMGQGLALSIADKGWFCTL